MRKHTGKILIIIYFILLASVFLNTAFSRNASKLKGTAEVNVAGMKLNVIKGTSKSTINVGAEEQEISFNVTNFEASTPSDVDYTYQIKVTNTNTSLPVTYELYKVDSGVQTKVDLTGGTTSKDFTMPKSTNQTDNFVLKVKMPDKSHKGESGYLNIDVSATQTPA